MSFSERLQSAFVRLLRWSEKYTKTDMVYLASGGFWSVITQFASAGIAFILLLFFSHFVSKETYGNYKYVLSVVALLSTLSLSGMSSAVFQSISRGHDGALSQGFWINLRWSALMFIGAVAGGAYYYFAGNTALAVGILVGGCLSPLIASSTLYASFLLAKKSFSRLALYNGILSNIVPAAALIATILVTQNIIAIIVVYFVANALTDLYFYLRVATLFKPDPSKHDPAMLSYGKHLSAISILGAIAMNIDQVLLFHFGGGLQLAVYSFATNPLNQYKGPLKTLDSMTQRQFANRPAREIRAGMRNKMLWLAFAAIAIVVIYIPLAPFLYRIFFPAYMDAVPYSQLFSLILLSTIGTPAGSYLTAKKHVRELYIDGIGSYSAQIALMVGGVIWWGMWGLVAARVIARLADAILIVVLYLIASRADEIAETGGEKD